MAGRGPAPKANRVRRNADPTPMRVLPHISATQPELPPTFPLQTKVDGDLVTVQHEWPEMTRQWWAIWGESALSAEFTATDWSVLLDTARLHAQMWLGDSKVAAEIRLREQKVGATIEDRARLRITFAQADEADGKRAVPASTSRGRRGPLRAVGDG